MGRARLALSGPAALAACGDPAPQPGPGQQPAARPRRRRRLRSPRPPGARHCSPKPSASPLPPAGSAPSAATITASRPLAWNRGRLPLASAGRGPEAHAAAGRLAVHYVVRQGRRWHVAGGRPDAVAGASFGRPDRRIRTDPGGDPMLPGAGRLHRPGVACTVAALVALTPAGATTVQDGIVVHRHDDAGKVDPAGGGPSSARRRRGSTARSCRRPGVGRSATPAASEARRATGRWTGGRGGSAASRRRRAAE